MGKTSKQVNVKFTQEQHEMLMQLIGPMGGTEAEVVRSIIVAWFSEKSMLMELIKKKLN